MTPQYFYFLTQKETQQIIRDNLQEDSHQFALAYRGPYREKISLIATQIKLLQKAEKKLPAFFQNQCILTAPAYEQASSERSAEMKFGDCAGKVALDLTCGLGVDARELASRFEKVIALESDPLLCEMAGYNFQRLGIKNIEVVHCDSPTWIEAYSGPPFDLIYLDPSRRDEKSGRRHFEIQDSHPNPFLFVDKLLTMGQQVMLKASPMIPPDRDRLSLPAVKEIIVQSIEGECKEVLFKMEADFSESPLWKAHWLRKSRGTYGSYHRELGEPLPSWDGIKYIYEGDVALYKSGLMASLVAEKFPHLTGGFTDGPGYYLSSKLDNSFPGSIWAFEEVLPFKPKLLKKYIRQFSHIQLGKRGVDISMAKIRKDYRIVMGGDLFLLFAQKMGKKIVMVGKKVE